MLGISCYSCFSSLYLMTFFTAFFFPVGCMQWNSFTILIIHVWLFSQEMWQTPIFFFHLAYKCLYLSLFFTISNLFCVLSICFHHSLIFLWLFICEILCSYGNSDVSVLLPQHCIHNHSSFRSGISTFRKKWVNKCNVSYVFKYKFTWKHTCFCAATPLASLHYNFFVPSFTVERRSAARDPKCW